MSTSVQSARHFDTIVVGAGVSGLACAARLFQHRARHGGSSLAVLEARDRIGGRVGSVYVNGNRLDTGANWIHGIGTEECPNPLMKVLPHKRYRELSGSVLFRPPDGGAVTTKSTEDSGLSNGWENVTHGTPPSQTNSSAGDLVIPSQDAADLMGAMWGTVGSLHEVAASISAAEAKQTTVLKAITKSEAFTGAFKDLRSRYHPALKALPQFVENMEAGPLVAQSSEHIQDKPGLSLLEYAVDDFDGDQVFLQDGYLEVVNELAKDLVESESINTNVEVVHINWDTNPIIVETSAGKYAAKNVVCTLPLGVLKYAQVHAVNGKPMFKPSLPREKTEAISSLGFGTLDKIFLVFENAWWTEEAYASIWRKGFTRRPLGPPGDGNDDNQSSPDDVQEPDSFMGFTHELPGVEIDEDGTTTSGARTISVINLNSLTGFPVLSSFVSCDNASYIEGLSDSDAGAIVHRALSRWFGREIPKPEAVHVTRWAQDKFSYGSYSHMITGLSETKHREAFQQPVRNRQGAELRFAGEHTTTDTFATVHAALMSGWREADDIMKRGVS